MTKRVLVVDYGVGNLLSVCRAFEACGADVELTGLDRQRIAAAERLVLPGVGAFGDCMDELAARGLIEPILDFIASGRPLLGICVGMQMLMEVGEEFGEHDGLGLVPGRVAPFPTRRATAAAQDPAYRLERADQAAPRTRNWNGTILEGMPGRARCYFVHSFTAEPTDDGYRLADCDYQRPPHLGRVARGQRLRHAVPSREERRHRLRILRNFLAL